MSDRSAVRRVWERKQTIDGSCTHQRFHRSPFQVPPVDDGLAFKPSDVRPIVEGLRDNSLQTDYFYVGPEKYLVTTVLENLYLARSLNSKHSGVIICRQAPYILIATYQGDVLAATRAMPVIDDILDEMRELTPAP